MQEPGFVPAWRPLGAFLVLGLLAVLALPSVPGLLALPGRLEDAQFAITCLGVIALGAAYLYLVAAKYLTLDLKWVGWNLIFVTGLAIVKFILSPIAYEKSGSSLSTSLIVGIALMPIYLGALRLILVFARRQHAGSSLSSSAGVAGGLAVLAVVVRLLVTRILGNADDPDIFGVGLILPLMVGVASFSLMQGFDRAKASLRSAGGVAISLVVVLHVFWVAYMLVLFS